ncbi:flavodoxin family protein, partial [Verminephrobacter sp. Larva24]
LFTRALRALFAWRCKVTWLQLHDMNAVTAHDRNHFIEHVARKLQSL